MKLKHQCIFKFILNSKYMSVNKFSDFKRLLEYLHKNVVFNNLYSIHFFKVNFLNFILTEKRRRDQKKERKERD